MKPPPSHEELRQMLPAAALGSLEPEEHDIVLAHVGECQECTRMLEEYRNVTGWLALHLSPQRRDPARAALVRTRLLARTRQHPNLGTAKPRADTRGLHRRFRALAAAERWSGWMVAAGLAALLVNHHAIHRPLDYGWIVAGVLAVALVILGLYAGVQRRRVSALLQRMDESEADESA
jgi:anti-sigma factor RsiW